MSRIPPLALEELAPALRQSIEQGAEMMGFLPNDALVMARHPALLQAMSALVGAVYGPSRVDNGLKRLIGEATSKAAGCVYCTAHAAHGAHNAGVSAEKIAAVWNADESDLFTPAERVAIRVAMRAGLSPNEVTDEDMAELREHFSDDEIIEIVGVIAMFGFLNRWNSTLNTTLEPKPAGVLSDLTVPN